MERQLIIAHNLEELRVELNKLRDKGVDLEKIAWWGWDQETIETDANITFSPGRGRSR